MPIVESTTRTVDARYIARCAVKGCRTTTSALVRETHRYTVAEHPITGQVSRDSRATRDEIVEGRIRDPRTLEPGWSLDGFGYLMARLECHPSRARVVRVKGRLNAAKKCDARCEGAVGPNCECSCAGANHGAGHALTAA